MRIETGVRQGDEVSVHYDPMIAKLVVWGSDRTSALNKLRSCLAEYNVDGLQTNVDFLIRLASHSQFVAGDVDTDFISRHGDELFPAAAGKRLPDAEEVCFGALALLLGEAHQKASKATNEAVLRAESGFRVNNFLTRKVTLGVGGCDVVVTVVNLGSSRQVLEVEEVCLYFVNLLKYNNYYII